MGVINTEPKAQVPSQKASQDNLEAMVTFRLTSKQLDELKAKAKKEKRSISNFIKTQLFQW
jgi:hypothetical protein